MFFFYYSRPNVLSRETCFNFTESTFFLFIFIYDIICVGRMHYCSPRLIEINLTVSLAIACQRPDTINIFINFIHNFRTIICFICHVYKYKLENRSKYLYNTGFTRITIQVPNIDKKKLYFLRIFFFFGGVHNYFLRGLIK